MDVRPKFLAGAAEPILSKRLLSAQGQRGERGCEIGGWERRAARRAAVQSRILSIKFYFEGFSDPPLYFPSPNLAGPLY